MPFEVTNIRPEPLGGHGTAEAVAAAIAKTYDRVASLGGNIVASHTLVIPQYPKPTEELFLVAQLPDGVQTEGVVTIHAVPDGRPRF